MFCLQVLVEMGVSRIVVRQQEKESDTQCEDRQDKPANHAEVKQEELHLVALHQSHTLADSFLAAHLGVVFQDKFRHGVGILFDEARNDEQQCPEQDVDAFQQLSQGM